MKEELTDAERDFLKFALAVINGSRYGITEESEF
jgi:hypothetical protein